MYKEPSSVIKIIVLIIWKEGAGYRYFLEKKKKKTEKKLTTDIFKF